MSTVRLTTAQALVRMMAAQMTGIDGATVPYFAGVWAIFGHGNVAGIGEALDGIGSALPTLRAHTEQGMVHAATAFAKAQRRRRAMAATSSIGPGALNMVTGAAVAHVNRLPLLLLPGDVFAGRGPDPVLQQIEDFGDGTITANDCFRPVSRYFDRIVRPEQLIPAFRRAMAVLTDPAECGPVTLSLCQDVQAEAFDFPEHLFAPRLVRMRQPQPDQAELAAAVAAIRTARRPLLIAGGGVLYAGAEAALGRFCADRGLPAAETQAGKSGLVTADGSAMGGIGVSGTECANTLAAEADLVIALGTRLADFTTGSRALFAQNSRLIAVNTQPFDAGKQGALPLVGDAGVALALLDAALGDWRPDPDWTARATSLRAQWDEAAAGFTAAPSPAGTSLPSDAQVIGAVQRASQPGDIVVGAAGGLPAELHKHWRPGQAGGYHMEYGFSCMGYELAGGLGVKLASPERDVIVMLGDGSTLMLNSEIATSVMLGQKLIVVLLDNRGFACINRLQRATGNASFNNLLADSRHIATLPEIDFVSLARGLGALSEKVADVAELEKAIGRARQAERTSVLVIDTDPMATTTLGGAWWDVAVPEVSSHAPVRAARAAHDLARTRQHTGA